MSTGPTSNAAPVHPVGYTPGPWTITRFAACDTEDGNASTVISCFADEDGREGATLAEVNRWTYGDDPATAESDCNARLISAAPDMVEFIVSVLRDRDRFSAEEYAAAREILTKALGV